MGAQAQKYTPAQRAMMFSQSTRQHIQTLASVPVVPGGSVSFEIPKARLLSKISLLVVGTITATKADGAAFSLKPAAPFNLVKNYRVEINNGFAPFRTSGRGLAWYNKTLAGGDSLKVQTAANSRGRVLFETAASAGGTVDDVRFELDLPFTVNERDAISLVNVQNPTTIVTVNIDFNQLTDLLADATNYTLVGNLSVIPVIETFTIPLLKEAIPDMSVLKLVNEFDQSIPGAGDVTIKLSPGYTYRKVLLYFEDAAGVPFTDADLTDIFIRLNQADTPYKINPYALAAENHKRYGYPLDSGLYVLDWATIAGQVNLAGSRDFVDAERITEFWIQTNSNKSGKVTVVTETLARLAG